MYIPSLTGLRILAAWIIFFHHLNPVRDLKSFWYYFFREGHISLTIFFVLSGFIIAKRYYAEATPNVSFLKKYFFLRFARIYPAFWVLTTGSFVVFYFSKGDFEWQLYWLNITFLKGFSDFYKFTGIAQTWSLTVEECFYASAPFIFFLHKTRHYFWRNLWVLYGLGFLIYWCMPTHSRFFETLHFTTYYTFLGRGFDFFAGFGVYLLLQKHATPFSKNWLTFLGIFGFLGVWLLLGYCQYCFVLINDAVLFVLLNVLLPFVIAVLIAGLVVEKSLFARFLSVPFMQHLGNSSYIFYLIHIGLFTKLLEWVSWPWYFGLINTVAWLMHRCFEKPVHQYLKGRG